MKPLYRDFPDMQTIAEEATDWPGYSRPTFEGWFGFWYEMDDGLDA